MTLIWVDAQISPSVARWLTEQFESVEAHAVRNVGLREAQDVSIFDAAAAAGAVVLTKDDDFRTLSEARSPAPAVILLTCGNTSNARLRQILSPTLERAIELLARGSSVVAIQDENSLK